MFKTGSFRVYTRTIVAATALAAYAVIGVTPAAAQAKAAAAKPTLDITLMKPTTARTGDNAFEVVVKDAAGKPVTDADVSVIFHMAAMPAMKMPEMNHTVTLKHQKGGTYTGHGQVMMAGKWDVTVMVKRGSKEIGSKKFPVAAQ